MILEGEQPVEEVGVGLGYNIPPGGTWLVNTCQDNQVSELNWDKAMDVFTLSAIGLLSHNELHPNLS